MHWLDKYSVIFFDKLDSTNLEAKRLISRGIDDDYLIVASEQSVGKGRNGKFWCSPEGNLYFSITLNHKNDLSNLSQISLITSLSCCEAIYSILEESEPSLFPRSLKIKWPNDLLINDKKFCGILLESVPYMVPVENKIIYYLIIGVGMNLKSSPKNLDYLTTSLKEEGINYNSRNDLLHKIMEKFSVNYKLWTTKGFADIKHRWMHYAYNVGKKISVNVNGKKIVGLFKDLDNNGQMVIEEDSGAICKIATCDIQFI
ncbi:MAG: biotin--[acetyl-CoA-carboxylase] ligase [Rickettsiales bacterium]|nr:biotin--[acetyl-CoA-carboxylase] ligase [Rickettsiales bacterium]